jgi:DNA-binding transcriptional MerR regulator
MMIVAEQLVNTEDAARAVNVHPATLRRWAAAGEVTPADRTLGGHARWNIDTLREQIRAAREKS